MKNHLVSEKFLSFSSRIKQPSRRLVIKVLLGSNTKRNKKTQSLQNYDGVDATKQKEKDKFIGLPPNKRYCLTPLARHKVMESRIVVFGAQTISSPHHGFIRQSYFISRKMFHALL